MPASRKDTRFVEQLGGIVKSRPGKSTQKTRREPDAGVFGGGQEPIDVSLWVDENPYPVVMGQA